MVRRFKCLVVDVRQVQLIENAIDFFRFLFEFRAIAIAVSLADIFLFVSSDGFDVIPAVHPASSHSVDKRMPEGVVIAPIMFFSVDTDVVQVACTRRRGRRQSSKEARGGVAPTILVVVKAIE
ncbi:hypothetical protein AYJ70_28575 [Pseudomonas monteilii]|uniref:Uncharacterized protein n=1 Tax=Pseudomonas monteilii TaxID=76759 RepID=A0AAP7FIK1_9PSED|nr:hypothetical protein AYJ70_28575 [Pseudomonas monteilii]